MQYSPVRLRRRSSIAATTAMAMAPLVETTVLPGEEVLARCGETGSMPSAGIVRRVSDGRSILSVFVRADLGVDLVMAVI